MTKGHPEDEPMGKSNHVTELRDLLGENALLLHWPRGSKGTRQRWGHLTIDAMNDPRYLAKLATGNIGVAQGEASNGLCSLDIDSDSEAEEFVSLNPTITNTLRSRGRRGCNLWWQFSGDYPGLTVLKRHGQSWGEFRSTGGQTIIYGQHPDGMDYSILSKVKPLPIEFTQIIWPVGVPPPGSVELWLPTPTERTEPTELSELTESAERTKVNERDSRALGLSSSIKSIDQAIVLATPVSFHQNHKHLFDLARAVMALEVNSGKNFNDMEIKAVFDRWHRSAKPYLRPELKNTTIGASFWKRGIMRSILWVSTLRIWLGSVLKKLCHRVASAISRTRT